MDKVYSFLKQFGIIVIGISGKKGAGKDLFYASVKAMSPSARRVAFADYLKHITRQQFGLSIEQTDGHLKEKPTKYGTGKYTLDKLEEIMWTPRQIMIDLGQFYRSVDPMFWLNKAFQVIKGYPSGTIVIVTDVRFPNEANEIKKHGGYMVRLQRKDSTREKIYPGCSGETNISETSLDDYKGFNFIVPEDRNENPQQLQQQVEKIIHEILKTNKTHA